MHAILVCKFRDGTISCDSNGMCVKFELMVEDLIRYVLLGSPVFLAAME